jgi:hypothetical protein
LQNPFLHVNPAQQQHVEEPPQPTEVHVFLIQLKLLARQVVPAVGFVVVGFLVVGEVVVGLLVGIIEGELVEGGGATMGAEVAVGLTDTDAVGLEVGFCGVGKDVDGFVVVGIIVDGFDEALPQERTGVFSAAYS